MTQRQDLGPALQVFPVYQIVLQPEEVHRLIVPLVDKARLGKETDIVIEGLDEYRMAWHEIGQSVRSGR